MFYFPFITLLLTEGHWFHTQGRKEPLQCVDGYFSYCERKCVLLNREGKLSL